MLTNELDIYDIRDIPHFAYVPSVLDFAFAAAALLAIGAGLLVWRRNNLARPKLSTLYQQLKEELHTIECKPLDKAQLALASLILRRFLSIAEKKDYLNMTPHELSDQAQLQPDAAIARVLQVISRLEQIRFSPISQADRELLNEALNTISDYNRSVQVK